MVSGEQSMNENLVERFGRGRAFGQPDRGPPITARPLITVERSIRKYVEQANQSGDPSNWTSFPEIPSSQEVFDEGRAGHEQALEILPSIVVGPYASKYDYLERHYSLLREDAVSPLRNAISEIQAFPHLMEKDSDNDAYIYEKVHITGLTFATAGIAARATFSLRRVGKKINWEQSKRLSTGTIVALSSAEDMFTASCRVAVVAARPLSGLQQNPAEIDLYFARPEEFEIDPQQEWVMVESRNGFYEANRHTLRALQALLKESFPLSEHIVELEREIFAPKYIEQQPLKDLSHLFPTGGKEALNVDILQEWPLELPSGLDASQIEALKRMLSKRLAIIQGPPGTGKTHVSVIALRLLLANMSPEDPPIIVSSHTNHAIDQLLRLMSQYEPEFIRLGGWTKDYEIIKPRTLYEVKEAIKHSNPKGGLRTPALMDLKRLEREMTLLLAPLTQGKEPLTSSLFNNYAVISDVQHESLVKGAKNWVRSGSENDMSGEMATWLGDDQVQANRRTMPEDLGIGFDEADLEFEQLKEIEAERRLVDEEDHDTLRGSRLVFNEPYTGRKVVGVTEQMVLSELKKQDMWNIPAEHRGPVYRYIQQKVKEAIRKEFRKIAAKYAKSTRDAKVGTWELDYNYLRQARIIGMTTTGLSKYRALLSSLNPKVVLIEEAAETLESSIAAACFTSLEHLILVGDHQQLRAHCNDEELAGKPFYLGISLFERLVRNNVEYSQLRRQRRMIPEIRRLLKPIYKHLHDHASVNGRLPVPGMGGANSYFFSHKCPESSDDLMSKTNHEEADMIVGFFNYLMHNGMMPEDIAVLTFYNGQRKLILRKLRECRHLHGGRFKVVTVDGYQGEENDVVLLSLVRSNRTMNIGFLENQNRICVALSRAQRGFYVFGDAPILCKSSMLWWQIVKVMASDPCRVGFHLPLTCKKHGDKTYIIRPQELESLDGGCAKPCREQLVCGHNCVLGCHPFSHDAVNCQKHCNRQLDCGHPCNQQCYLACKSDCTCESRDDEPIPPVSYAEVATNTSPSKKTPQISPVRRAPPLPVGPPVSYARAPTDTSPSKENLPLPPVRLHSPWLRDFPADSVQTGERYLSEETKPYRDYAAGGYIESDRDIATLADEDDAQAQRAQLDENGYAALFGSHEDAGTVEKTNEMTLVRMMPNGQGESRGVWKGNYKIPVAENDSKEEVSLLDL